MDLLLLSSFSFMRIWNSSITSHHAVTLRANGWFDLASLADLHLPHCRLCRRWSCPFLRCSASGNHPSWRLWCVLKTSDLVCTRTERESKWETLQEKFTAVTQTRSPRARRKSLIITLLLQNSFQRDQMQSVLFSGVSRWTLACGGHSHSCIAGFVDDDTFAGLVHVVV